LGVGEWRSGRRRCAYVWNEKKKKKRKKEKGKVVRVMPYVPRRWKSGSVGRRLSRRARAYLTSGLELRIEGSFGDCQGHPSQTRPGTWMTRRWARIVRHRLALGVVEVRMDMRDAGNNIQRQHQQGQAGCITQQQGDSSDRPCC